MQERQEDLKSAINIAAKIGPSEKTSKAIETLEKAKSDLSSHCGDLEDKLNYRLSLDLQNLKDLEMDANIEESSAAGRGNTTTESEFGTTNNMSSELVQFINIIFILPGAPYVPGSFAKKQISKIYGDKLKFHNSWEDSVSLFYSWLKKEEESVKTKEIPVGDVQAISKAIKDAEV